MRLILSAGREYATWALMSPMNRKFIINLSLLINISQCQIDRQWRGLVLFLLFVCVNSASSASGASARTLSILISTVTEFTANPEARETAQIVEKEFLQTFAPDITPLFIAADSPEQMTAQLHELVGPNDKIIRLVFLGHGVTQPDGFKLLFNQSEHIVIKPNEANLKAREFFAPIYGKFTDGAVIHFSNCRLFEGTLTIVKERANAIRSILGINNGFLYANEKQGSTFNYLNGFRDMIQARKANIITMLIPTYLMLAAMLTPYWSAVMSERVSVLLLIPFVMAAEIVVEHIQAVRLKGYLFEIKNKIVQSNFTKITEFLN